MKNTWKIMLAAILAASMLMTTPGLSIYAADLTDEEIIESCEEAAGEMEIAGDTQEDSAYIESEIAEEAEEQPGEVLTEITEEPARNMHFLQRICPRKKQSVQLPANIRLEMEFRLRMTPLPEAFRYTALPRPAGHYGQIGWRRLESTGIQLNRFR